MRNEWFVVGRALFEGEDGLEAGPRAREGAFRVMCIKQATYAIVNLRHGKEIPTRCVLVVNEAASRVAVV